jgi:threonine aldolase
MRQVGILCAAALVALHENVEKLESDHKNARFLAGMFFTMLTYQIKTQK